MRLIINEMEIIKIIKFTKKLPIITAKGNSISRYIDLSKLLFNFSADII